MLCTPFSRDESGCTVESRDQVSKCKSEPLIFGEGGVGMKGKGKAWEGS